MFFCFWEQKLFFKIQFPNTIFLKKTPKTVLKNCSQKLFSRTVFKNSNQTGPNIFCFLFPWCEQVVSELLSSQTIFSLVHNSIILNYVSISYICAAGCSYPCQIPHGKYILHLDDRWRYGMTQFKSYENLSRDASIGSINQWTRLGENLKMNCESCFLHQFFLFVARNTKCGAWCFLFATCFTRILIYQF